MENNVHILVVEDSPTQAAELQYLLEKNHFQVTVANDGRQALEKLHHITPTIIISDIVMPEMNGYELCDTIKGDNSLKDIPVILLTSLSDPEDVINGLSCGANNFIVKPYDEHFLLSRIRYILANMEIRKTASSQMGIEIIFRDKRYFLTSERVQMIDLLLSTYEAAIQRNLDFQVTNGKLQQARDELEMRVQERTAELLTANVQLQKEIEERTRAEHRDRLAREVLDLLNRRERGSELVRDILLLIKDRTEFEAVAIRLKEGEDFPYYETNGFPGDFVQAERFLCRKDGAGKMVRDGKGDPVLECMCGNILCGRIDPSLSFFTGGGSFWTNKSSMLPVMAGAEGRAVCPRNRCISDGYESVALIPLHADGKIIGLLQLNDPRPDCFTKEMVYFFEGIGASVGIALARSRAEKALRENEERFRSIFEYSTIGKSLMTPDGRFLQVNPAFAVMLGYTAEELQGIYLEDITHPDDIAASRECLRCLLTNERSSYRMEKRYIHRNGSPVDTYLSTTLLRNSSGAPLHLITSVLDITERKLAEEALRESEAKYKRLVEGSPDIVWVLSDKEGTLYVSSRVEAILGYPPDYFSKNPWLWNTSIHPDDRGFVAGEIIAVASGKDLDIEYRIKDASGNWRWFNDRSIGRFVNGDETIIEGMSTDITEGRLLEEQLRQSQKMEAIGTLAGGISHDFNNILTTIIGNAQLALLDVDKEGALYEEIEEIRKAGERAAALTRQLLAFSRRQIFQTRILDLNELLTDMEKMLGRLIGEDIELLMIPASELCQVEADPGQMEQIIMNLAVNAKDAMPKGGRLTIETDNVDLDNAYFHKHGIVDEQPGAYVMLAVSDTGIGMDKEIQEHIFEPFFTTKGIGKGTGLGLSTVYGIVKQNNGFIWTYSEAGQGSVFKIYLPRVKQAPASKNNEPPAVSDLGGSETVLIVEDDVSLRRLARIILEQKGYKVLEAEDGEEALRVAEAHDGSIDLVITDVVMPKMGGREVVKRLAPLYPHIKAMYMSGYTDNAIVHHGVLETGLNFIQKPFTPKALARKVRDILNS